MVKGLEDLVFYPRRRFVFWCGGVMAIGLFVLAVLRWDESVLQTVGLLAAGAIFPALFVAPYALREEPTLRLNADGLTLIPTFSRRIFVPWHCLASARTAIRAKHHLRLEVDWTVLRGDEVDPSGASLPPDRAAPIDLYGLRRIDLDMPVHEVLMLIASYKDKALKRAS